MRLLVFGILIFTLSGCQMGLIPCPKNKESRLKRAFNRPPKIERSTVTASAKSHDPEVRKRVPYKVTEHTPPLEKINVEEWDCPKPGVKRTVPKAVKDNIRKNKKAYESYYKTRHQQDSLSYPSTKAN